MLRGRDPYARLTPDGLLAALAGATPARTPGTGGVHYSNLGVGVLGQALAHAAGTSYGALVEERVCRPLGLVDTATHDRLTDEQRARLAPGHRGRRRPADPWPLDGLPGAGALRSTADDLLRYLAAQLEPDSTPWPTPSGSPSSPASRARQPIGLGWLRNDGPDPLWWHNGGTGGFRSFAGFVPTRRTGVVVLSNHARSVDLLGSGLLHADRAVRHWPQACTERGRPARVGTCSPSTPSPSAPTTRSAAWWWGSDRIPTPPDGWTTVTVKAASLNHHDLWSLRGVGLKEDALPMILGCDAAGLDEDGNEVVVHAVISDPAWSGDETLDPRRSLLSERHQGTFADQVVVPRGNLVPKPASMSFAEAACLPTAWLTAYRMLFTQGGLKPGDTVLVQGAGGGVATALITLARAGGLTVLATSRDEAKRQRALEIGAHEVFESGARLPVKVDAVMETVGRATWSHSIRSLRPGGKVVISGTTSGPEARRRRAHPHLLPPAPGDRLHHGHPGRAGLAGQPARRDRHPAPRRPHPADGRRPRRLRRDGGR